MAVNWTKEQAQVINLRDRNILVSAAAGSGKTAVLVERILTMVTEGDNPIDIDNLLVVTFTKAAAGEMKERILSALEKRLAEEPENEHLQRQTTFIHNAQINTIHGFCGYVIKNYFHLIDLDPGYRVAEESELKLLKMEVAGEVIEAAYEENSEEFLKFIEWYAAGKSDDEIEEIIIRLHEFAMSHPWPEKWLQECAAEYQREPKEASWVIKMHEDIALNLAEALIIAKENIEIASESDGPYMYMEVLEAEHDILEGITAAKEYDDLSELLRGFKLERLPGKKDSNVSGAKREQIQGKRKEIGKIVNGIKELYFYAEPASVWQDIMACGSVVQELVKLTLDFKELFTAKKRKRNILDYGDMEHMALDILVTEEDGIVTPTTAAKELSDCFAEIMIDEYQDSNYVQEMILSSVSKQSQYKNNIFMVGDVKQSIYSFRLACPEIFMDKYHNYTREDSDCQKIDLHKNFRSRVEVLDTVNYLFERIMHESLGGITYDEEAALNEGATFMLGNDPEFAKTEIVIVEKDDELLDEEDNVNAREMEARAIANRIEEIVGNEEIFDKKINRYRPAEYRDCVVLLRTISGWGDVFAQVLSDTGIPAYVTSRTGYFSALEVVTVLNYLHICDNPRQEIPFTAILRSPIVGCTDEELAQIKSAYPRIKMYDAIKTYYEDNSVEGQGAETELFGKLKIFYETFDKVRGRVSYTPIHELINYILEETQYEAFVSAMPAGEQRSANIKMLVEKAKEFEKTSYRGLFNFIRYIEYLHKFKVDYGEVNVNGEQENTVRIMSVHQSKGLEFPIVFAAGMGKSFNLKDGYKPIVLHPDYGIGTGNINPQSRLRTPTLLKQVIKRQIVAENLGEEMRILYVALTRAKEKLIITGTISELPKRVQSCANLLKREVETIPYVERLKARDYWAWILPALARNAALVELYHRYDIEYGDAKIETNDIDINVIGAGELVAREVTSQTMRNVDKEFLQHLDKRGLADEDLMQELDKKFSYVYPYESQIKVPVKVTVSELKSQMKQMAEEEGRDYTPDIIPLVPSFIETKQEEITGANRGTAYHLVMECLDFALTDSKEQIDNQLEQLRKRGQIDDITRAVVSADDIWLFINSKLGQRMKKADSDNKLHREQPFVMSVPATEKDSSFSDEDTILVQGIIDVFFEEGDNIIVADYKTDKVRLGQEEELAEKYSKQLDYYAEAIERVTGKKVTEKIIYSFTLAKEI